MRFSAPSTVVLGSLLVAACSGSGGPPPWHSVHLTWQGDTSTTMTVNLVVEADGIGERLPRSASVEWRASGADGAPSSIPGEPVEIAGVPDVRVYRFELRDLEPGASYDFQTVLDGRPAGVWRSFRTIPREGPVRLASGGDIGAEPLSLALLEQAGRQSPHLLAIGGDLSYANGLISNWPRWRTWLEYVTDALVTPDGHTVPLVLAIGNHEVNVGRAGGVPASAPPERKAPFYYALFAQNQGAETSADTGGATYFRRGLGAAGALYVLDSGHLVSHEDQVPWLEDQLEADADLPNRLALHHVPLYPAHRSYEASAEGRDAWEEVFHHGRLTAAFENHDHVLKRSHPIRLGEVVGAGEGVLYLGDGCMGQDARTVDLEERWYIARSASEPHFWMAELSDEGAIFRAFDEEGILLDVVSTGQVELPPDAGASLPDLDRIVEMPGGAVELEPLWTAAADGPARIAGVLRNTTDFAMSAELSVDALAPVASAPLPPGSEMPIDSLFDEGGPEVGAEGASVSYEVRFDTGEGGSVTRGRVLLAPVELRSLSHAAFPLRDASRAEWQKAGIEALTFAEPAEIHAETAGDPFQGPADASADLYLGWDEEALYLRADVTDDVVVGAEADAGTDWSDVDPDDVEAVLLFIDPWPERGREIDDAHVATGPVGSEFEIEAHPAWTGEAPDTMVEVHESGQGYTAHVTVPWGWVTGAGAPERVALNVGLVDSDGSEQVHELYWFSSWENPERPLGQGTFRLTP